MTSDSSDVGQLSDLQSMPDLTWLKQSGDSDGRTLRDAFGLFATGVTVIACAKANGHVAGLTANSFSSVSLDPPLVLWSLNRNAPCREAFAASTHYGINVLSAHQRDLSDHFARPCEDKFSGIPAKTGPFGVPLLNDVLASFVCRNDKQYDGGDHIIFVGEVICLRTNPRDPLLFFSGKYRDIDSSA